MKTLHTHVTADAESSDDRHDELCVHIFTASATLVGVCLTVIGLIRVILSIHQIDTLVDDILSLNAVIFLMACLTSYTAIRTRRQPLRRRWERLADLIFLVALTLMAVVCALITYALI